MTAPVAVAPVVAPVAPVVVVPPADPESISAVINSSDDDFAKLFDLPVPPPPGEAAPVADPEPAAVIEQLAEAEGQPRDAEGKFVAKEGEPAVEAGPAEEPEAKPVREPITPFVIYDEEGDEVDLTNLLDKQIEYKANGKVYREPLDKVVRLAQSGRYNEALQEEVTQLRAETGKSEGVEAEFAEYRSKSAAELVKLLEDDDYLMERRTKWAAHNTPEREVERLRQENTRIRNNQEAAGRQTALEGFVSTKIEPVLVEFATKYPTITPDELLGRFDRVVAPYKRNGIVPPQYWDKVESLLESEIGPWVAHTHESRTTERAASSEAAKAEVRKAKVETTKAKKVIARTVAPAGSAPSGEVKRKPIVTAADAEEDIIAGLTASLSSP